MFLPDQKESLTSLTSKIPVKYRISQGKHISESEFEGYFVKLSLDSAELITKNSLKVFSNLQIQLAVENEQLNRQHLYGKIIKILDDNQNYFHLRFTALPTEIKTYFQDLCE